MDPNVTTIVTCTCLPGLISEHALAVIEVDGAGHVIRSYTTTASAVRTLAPALFDAIDARDVFAPTRTAIGETTVAYWYPIP